MEIATELRCIVIIDNETKAWVCFELVADELRPDLLDHLREYAVEHSVQCITLSEYLGVVEMYARQILLDTASILIVSKSLPEYGEKIERFEFAHGLLQLSYKLRSLDFIPIVTHPT